MYYIMQCCIIYLLSTEVHMQELKCIQLNCTLSRVRWEKNVSIDMARWTRLTLMLYDAFENKYVYLLKICCWF